MAPGKEEPEFSNETYQKVYLVLRKYGLDRIQAINAMRDIWLEDIDFSEIVED